MEKHLEAKRLAEEEKRLEVARKAERERNRRRRSGGGGGGQVAPDGHGSLQQAVDHVVHIVPETAHVVLVVGHQAQFCSRSVTRRTSASATTGGTRWDTSPP